MFKISQHQIKVCEQPWCHCSKSAKILNCIETWRRLCQLPSTLSCTQPAYCWPPADFFFFSFQEAHEWINELWHPRCCLDAVTVIKCMHYCHDLDIRSLICPQNCRPICVWVFELFHVNRKECSWVLSGMIPGAFYHWKFPYLFIQYRLTLE